MRSPQPELEPARELTRISDFHHLGGNDEEMGILTLVEVTLRGCYSRTSLQHHKDSSEVTQQ